MVGADLSDQYDSEQGKQGPHVAYDTMYAETTLAWQSFAECKAKMSDPGGSILPLKFYFFRAPFLKLK